MIASINRIEADPNPPLIFIWPIGSASRSDAELQRHIASAGNRQIHSQKDYLIRAEPREEV